MFEDQINEKSNMVDISFDNYTLCSNYVNNN